MKWVKNVGEMMGFAKLKVQVICRTISVSKSEIHVDS